MQSGQLIPLLPQWRPNQKMAVHAVYARREHLDPKIRLFIDFLKESFGPNPYWEQRLAPWLGGKLSGTEE